jgi:uncharacterized damage-inducible protein DinB
MRISIAISAMLTLAFVLNAQNANPLSGEALQAYTVAKNNILGSAQKMPEENYAFKPAPRVRTFGQLLGHVAEEQYFFCSSVKGEQKAMDIEKTKTSKADLIAALKDSFAYCDGAYNGLTDATAVQMLKLGDTRVSKVGMLWNNTIHDNLHYGNIITYLRIKGLVPPSTEGQ